MRYVQRRTFLAPHWAGKGKKNEAKKIFMGKVGKYN
jgi:hypothetical protein